jgi:hypothetical protein
MTVLVTKGARKTLVTTAAIARMADPFEQALVTAQLSLGAVVRVTLSLMSPP